MIRVLMADDHPVVRAGIRALLSSHRDIVLAGEAADGEALLDLLRATPADVLLLDITMPGPGFLELLSKIRAVKPGIRLLILTMHRGEQYALRAIRSGAAGYLTKATLPEELSEAIRRVAAGGRYVSSDVAEFLMLALSEAQDRPLHDTLSEREFQVLCLAARGRAVQQIARELSLSPKTVSTYRARILDKLGLTSHADAIRYAIEHQLVS